MLSFLFSKVGAIAALAVVCFLAGAIVCWRWTHRAEKQIETSYSVAGVANGATITIQEGPLKKRTRPLFLAGISAPGLNDALGTDSRASLLKLAGDTVRVESEKQGLLGRAVVGTVYGATGVDLAAAQLRAGLATCETGATKDQIAAQREAQKAKRGLWANSGGSHWWNFSVASLGDFSKPESPLEAPMLNVLDFGLLLEIAVVAIVAAWIFWYLFGAAITARFTSASAVTAAVAKTVDVSEEVAAYTALTGVRYMPNVSADPQAVTACEYLLTAVMKWSAAANTPAKSA